MTEFYLTRMGRQFYESTMPELVKQLADLNANLRKHNGPEVKEVDSVLVADAKRALDGKVAPWGSEVRRKLGIARGKLIDVQDALRDSGEHWASAVKELDETLAETADPWPEPHQVSDPSTAEEIKASDNRVIRENFGTSMLKNLLARIHRDGGQHTEAVGVAQSFYDADNRVAELNARSDEWKAGPPWLRDAAVALGQTTQTGEPLALNWNQVITEIRNLRHRMMVAEKQARRLADIESHAVRSEMAARSEELSLTQQLEDMTKRHQKLDANFLNLHVKYRSAAEKLELVNTILGIVEEDSYEHFKEQLSNALKES